jgi:phytoene dehydrogenase-like protein
MNQLQITHHGGPQADVIIVGGGLAGLTAATFLARAGRSVMLLEKSQHIGGRAITQTEAGFHFNLGPHALFRHGLGAAILAELGVTFTGGIPPTDDYYALRQGKLYNLPADPTSLLTTSLLSFPARQEAIRLLASLHTVKTETLQGVTVQEWLETQTSHPEVHQFLHTFIRMATYTNAPTRFSAGSALAQLQLAATGNVWYIDGGWQTLVDGLYQAALAAGVKLTTAARVTHVERDERGAVRGVRLADGTKYPTMAVVITADPQTACKLVEGGEQTELRRWAEQAIPVKMACLTVALRRLPQPEQRVAFGFDQPLYLSTHSAYARLAPTGSALVYLGKYLDPDVPTNPSVNQKELETMLDLVQPGWRNEVVTSQFLPQMTVSNAMVTAAQGGQKNRPGPEVPYVPGLYVAGDWVGPDGLLSNTALASARQAAELILSKQQKEQKVTSFQASIALSL